MTIEGRSTTLIALSDFVGNLGTSPLLLKPIEIVNSQVTGDPGQELVEFTVRANINRPDQPAAAPTGRGGRGAGAGRGRQGGAS
jgi:hypothetical protein